MEDSRNLINQLITKNTPHFLTLRGRPKKRLIRQLELYVFKNLAHQPYQDLMKQFNVSKSALFLNVRKFKLFLKNTPNFKGLEAFN